MKIYTTLLLAGLLVSGCAGRGRPSLPLMPEIRKPLPPDSVPIGDVKSAPEVKLNLAIAPGPFAPTWASIDKNYPGTPEWLRETKFGIWVHFGPQASGQSGDWYARKMYVPGTSAYENHLKKFGHPSESGTRKFCAIGIPRSLIRRRSQKFITMPARAS